MFERAIVKVLTIVVLVPVAMRYLGVWRRVMLWFYDNLSLPRSVQDAILEYLYPQQAYIHFRRATHEEV